MRVVANPIVLRSKTNGPMFHGTSPTSGRTITAAHLYRQLVRQCVFLKGCTSSHCLLVGVRLLLQG